MKRKILGTSLFLFLAILLQATTITTNKSTYIPGENITVTFSSATSKTDWVGMYISTITPGPQNSLAWLYLNGKQTVPSSIIENGTLNFTAPTKEGSYKICFHPNDGYTVSNTVSFSVSAIGAGPKASFYCSQMLVSPGTTVNFYDQSLNSPNFWSWTFPGGSPSESSLQNPSVKYNEAGTYSVTLSVSNADGSDQLIKPGYIKVSESSGTSTDVKIMHLNVWLEGSSVPNSETYFRDIIATVDPDIVCLVENSSATWIAKIENDLAAIGHYYYIGHINGSDASILSKFPITSSGPLLKSTISIFNVTVNGRDIVIAASHLDYLYYACYLPRGYNCGGSAPYSGWSQIGSPDPKPVTELSVIMNLNLGSKRDEQIVAFIDYVANETRPVIILGDFNEPSFQDWTSRQADLFDHHGVIYEWNTTMSLEKSNFKDAFREVYPDEVLNPGITWPSFATGVGSTSWTPKSDERDRIDYIFFRGDGLKASDAAIIGPRKSYVKNVLSEANTENDHFLAETLPWPSDHKGVFAAITIPNTSDSINSSIKGLHESLPFEIKAFPNPGSGNLNIVSTFDAIAQVSILNLGGNEVLRKKFHLSSNGVNELDISQIPNGIYLLKVICQENVQTLKILKN
jgi:PKD repeat protein